MNTFGGYPTRPQFPRKTRNCQIKFS